MFANLNFFQFYQYLIIKNIARSSIKNIITENYLYLFKIITAKDYSEFFIIFPSVS